MSDKPIWSLNAKRSELGGATKGQIYLSKIGIGIGVAFPLWLAHGFDVHAAALSSVAVFCTSKVCYYVNTDERPDGWTSLADWLCDCSLHLSWLLWPWLSTGSYVACLVLVGIWAATYPWSSE